MEQRAVADRVRLLHDGDAAVANRLIETFDGVEATVGKRFVDKRPKMLGRLQFGTVSGLEDEMNAIGHAHIVGAVPTGPVELQHDALFAPAATDLAKSARMSSNISLQTALATFHTVWPVAGSTNPVT